MIRRPPGSTRTDTLFPYTTLFRSPNKWLIYVAGPMLNDEANLLPQKGYWLLDANIYYRLDNGLTLSAYSRNITNTKYSSWGSTLGALGQNLFPGDPRTYGLRMTAEF